VAIASLVAPAPAFPVSAPLKRGATSSGVSPYLRPRVRKGRIRPAFSFGIPTTEARVAFSLVLQSIVNTPTGNCLSLFPSAAHSKNRRDFAFVRCTWILSERCRCSRSVSHRFSKKKLSGSLRCRAGQSDRMLRLSIFSVIQSRDAQLDAPASCSPNDG
jgi:hypothetical protein